MITTLHYKYGFIYKGIEYAWKDKKLFKLPYTKKNRSYSLKEIPFYCFKATIVYNIQKTKLTINKLKLLTSEVNWTLDVNVINDCPF
jgi:hypothetical protein